MSDVKILLEMFKRSSLHYEFHDEGDYKTIEIRDGSDIVYIDFDEYGNIE